jgi:hypothetical protein
MLACSACEAVSPANPVLDRLAGFSAILSWALSPLFARASESKGFDMTPPFFQICNMHGPDCGAPPTITNASPNKYCGYFQNRFGEQWVFVYDFETKKGELRGGDIGWDTIVSVTDGTVDVMLGKAEMAWLQECWQAATLAG